MKNLVKIFICIFCFGVSLYIYLDKLNSQSELKVQVPQIAKEIELIEQDLVNLNYQIESFKNPTHLLNLALRPEFGHLKFSRQSDVMLITPNIAKRANAPLENKLNSVHNKSLYPVVLGTKK